MKKVVYVSIIILMLFSITSITVNAAVFDCSVVTDVPQDECEALVFLYNSTNGDAWINHSNWLTGSTVGSWYGITVAGGHVYAIALNGNELSGPIPPQIGNLVGVTNLYFSDNQLSGSIPAEIGNIIALKYLYLGNNFLSGPIPAAIFTLPNILEIQFVQNLLTGQLPANMGDATTLTKFFAAYNNLSGPLPAGIGDLSNLTHLWIEYNDFYGPLPNDVKNLPTTLSLAINNSGYWSTVVEVQAYLTSRVPDWENTQSSQGLLPLVGGFVGWGELADTANFKPVFRFSKFFNNSGVEAEKYLIQLFNEGDGKYYLEKEVSNVDGCPLGGSTVASICEFIPAWNAFLFNPIPGNYYWKIHTWSGTNWIDKDDVRTFTLVSPPSVLYPTNTTTKINPTFQWASVQGAVGYNLWVADSGGNPVLDQYVSLSSCISTQCAFAPTIAQLNLAIGDYSWLVRADMGNNDFTDWGDATFTKVASPTAKFPAISSTTPSPKFTWTKVANQTRYQIQLFTSGGVKKLDKTLDAAVVCASNPCSYTPSPVLNLANGAYKWKVRAGDSVEMGTYSTMITFKKVTPPVPITPTGSITLTNPKFTWTKIPGATKYYLVLQTSTGALKRQVEITTPVCTTTTCSYTPNPVLNLAKGVYKWKVRAFNGYYGPYGVYLTFTKK